MEQQEFDQAYIDALVEGSASVEAHFTSYFGDLLYVKARARVRSAQLREDIVQETFARALAALRRGQIDKADRLGAFVCRICDHVIFEQYRKMGRDPMAPGEYPDVADDSADSEGRLVTAERKRLVRRIIAGMGGKDRRLLHALFVEDRDRDELCREMKLDRNQLRLLIHRAKARFRESLESAGIALLVLPLI